MRRPSKARRGLHPSGNTWGAAGPGDEGVVLIDQPAFEAIGLAALARLDLDGGVDDQLLELAVGVGVEAGVGVGAVDDKVGADLAGLAAE
jgi:hypothetical protein